MARLTTVLVLVWASGLAAQTTPSPPGQAATWLVGPVTLYPSIVLRDVGVDSNILNESDAPKEDFTLTAQPRLRAAVPIGSTLLSGSATVGFVYYATYKEQQSINRLFEGRFESVGGRLRPFLAGELSHTRERSGYEIDARVLRRNTSVSGGAELKLTGITSLTGSYRHTTQNYGEDVRFLETVLSAQLDQTIDVAVAGARYFVTPLTTLSVDVEFQRDRFETSTFRDADSVRIVPGAEFAPDAVITGRVAAGFRRFSPRDSRLDGFQGFVGSANLRYSLLGWTRFWVEGTRDVVYSFDPATPYYLLASARLTVSQRIGGPLDLIVVAGRDRLRYQSVGGLPRTGPVDRTQTVGGGVGLRLGPSMRLALIYDFTERVSSGINRRPYQRGRLFGSATYGQ